MHSAHILVEGKEYLRAVTFPILNIHTTQTVPTTMQVELTDGSMFSVSIHLETPLLPFTLKQFKPISQLNQFHGKFELGYISSCEHPIP